MSATALVSYARCPLQFYWSAVRPLPRPASPAARLGTEVHRWIERRAGAGAGLWEPEPEDGEDKGGWSARSGGDETPSPVEFRAAFLATPYASVAPLRVETPFELVVEGHLVRGRIDAVYVRDGRTELVDFKTGRRPDPGDAGARFQLDLYGVAAVEAWGLAPEEVRTTYCYLRPDGTADLESTDWDGGRLATVRRRLAGLMAGMGSGRFGARAGRWCEGCPFLDFCEAGQRATG